MKDSRKLPRLDFAASPWSHRNSFEHTCPTRKSASVIDLSPRLELGVALAGEAEDESPEQTEN
jgi:hypothetical protein